MPSAAEDYSSQALAPGLTHAVARAPLVLDVALAAQAAAGAPPAAPPAALFATVSAAPTHAPAPSTSTQLQLQLAQSLQRMTGDEAVDLFDDAILNTPGTDSYHPQ